MWKALIWKEWREHRGKMLALTAVYLTLVLTARIANGKDGFAFLTIATWIIVLIAPGFVAMGTITSEQRGTRQTCDTLRSLPAPIFRAFLIKVFAGILTASLPLLLIEILARFVIFPAEPAISQNVIAYTRWPLVVPLMLATTIALFLWTLALGGKCKSELTIAMVYITLVISNLSAIEFLTGIFHRGTYWSTGYGEAFYAIDHPALTEIVLSFSPLGPLAVSSMLHWPAVLSGESPELFQLVIRQYVILTLFFFIGLRQFTLDKSSIRSHSRPTPTSPLRLVTRPNLLPIAWKTWREMRGLALFAIAFISSLLFLHDLMLDFYYNSNHNNALLRGIQYAGNTLYESIGLAHLVAFFVVIVLGTEIGTRDYRHGLDFFWQSRPISQRNYFHKRYYFGLALACAIALWPAIILFTASFICQSFILPITPDPSRESFGALQNQHPWLFPFVGILIDGKYDAILYMMRFAPLVAITFALAAFLSTFGQRRIVSMVLTSGIVLTVWICMPAAPDHYLWANLMFKDGVWVHAGPYLLRFVAYSLSAIALCILLGYLASLSLRHRWRERLESISLLPNKNLPQGASL